MLHLENVNQVKKKRKKSGIWAANKQPGSLWALNRVAAQRAQRARKEIIVLSSKKDYFWLYMLCYLMLPLLIVERGAVCARFDKYLLQLISMHFVCCYAETITNMCFVVIWGNKSAHYQINQRTSMCLPLIWIIRLFTAYCVCVCSLRFRFSSSSFFLFFLFSCLCLIQGIASLLFALVLECFENASHRRISKIHLKCYSNGTQTKKHSLSVHTIDFKRYANI